MEAVALAATAIWAGELVIMPTETVYGLAADATNPRAIERIFALKGRPPSNPLIVHVNSVEMARTCVSAWPERAQTLAQAFWPGPLTLVLPKSPTIPSAVTAGLDSVGVRMPSHPIALALIGLCGRPLAAPSANPSNAVSPTRVEHLRPEILAGVAQVLDSGACDEGIESTVLQVLPEGIAVLRPGAIPRSELERFGPMLERGERSLSPGHMPRHYSPASTVKIVQKLEADDTGLTFGPARSPSQIKMPCDAKGYAHRLYDALHWLDAQGPDCIRIEAPPDTPEWEAVWDRLRRAASPK